MASKVNSEMIKPFAGDGDVVAWLTKVELVAKLHGITDLAVFIPLYLEGPALSLYLELDDPSKEKADAIKEKLKEAFADSKFVAYAKLMRLRWSGEQVDTFCSEVRRLAGLAGFSGDSLEQVVKLTLVNCFPDSISVALQQLSGIDSMSVSALLGHARILTARRGHVDVGVAAVAVQNEGGGQGLSGRGGVGVAAVAVRNEEGGRGSSGNSRRVVKCFGCGGPHLVRFCKSNGMRCFNCSEVGHMARNCPLAQSDQGNE